MDEARRPGSDPGAHRWAADAPLRVLAGPFVAPEHSDYMRGAFDDFDTITFGSWPAADLILPPSADFRTVLDALPEGWAPDLMIWWRPEYTTIPEGLEKAPFPVAMLTSDWYLAWRGTRSAADWADVVVTGTRGEPVFRAAGVENVVALPMLGFEPGLDGAYVSAGRDIDVLCAGNARWSIHRDREHVVAALLDLPPTVAFQHPPFVDRREYNRLLGRSKIFVNRTVIGEINMKCYEVPAAGACLFLERDNLDARDYFVDGESVVLYDREDLVDKVLYYLAHDEEREAIAAAGRAAMRGLTYRDNMRRLIEHLRSTGCERLLARPRPITRFDADEIARRRAVHSVLCMRSDDDELARIDAVARDGHARDVALRAVVHGRARTAADTLGLVSPALSQDDLHTMVDTAVAHDDGDVCLNLVALFQALARRDLETIAPRFERVVDQLESGVDFGPAETFVVGLDPDRHFRLERARWEAVERGEDPDAVLRVHLLDACLVTRASVAEQSGHDDDAVGWLERAIDVHPDGHRARVCLASIHARHRRFALAASVLDEHLARHPLDDAAALNRILHRLQLGDPAACARELAALRRRVMVFGHTDWIPTLARLEAMSARLEPRSIATTPR